MKQALTKRKGTGVLVLFLFGLFAVCIMMVLMLGARTYNALVQRDEDSYRQRAATQYIAAKVRHTDALDAVTVGSFSADSDLPCLFLRQEIGGEDYVTRIYCCDGYLRELFTMADVELAPENGQEVLPAAGLELSLTGGVLEASVTDQNGEAADLRLILRSGKGDLS